MKPILENAYHALEAVKSIFVFSDLKNTIGLAMLFRKYEKRKLSQIVKKKWSSEFFSAFRKCYAVMQVYKNILYSIDFLKMKPFPPFGNALHMIILRFC
jgi:hypothetical protein